LTPPVTATGWRYGFVIPEPRKPISGNSLALLIWGDMGFASGTPFELFVSGHLAWIGRSGQAVDVRRK
jgi:hypothetical protein